MLISRSIQPTLHKIATQFPVIALLGPRQSGKTTLARLNFSNHKYISLEDLDVRTQALEDSREFLEFHKNSYGLILDEIQNAPTLLSYIQTQVDQVRTPGYFILTGSQNFLVNQWSKLSGSDPADNYLICAGIEGQKRKNGQVLSWQDSDAIILRNVISKSS